MKPKWIDNRLAMTNVQPGANVPHTLASAKFASSAQDALKRLGPQPIVSGTAGAGLNIARLTVGV